MNIDDEALGFWTRTVWSYSALSASNRLFLLALAYLANPAGNVTVTQGALASLLNVHTRTVRAALKACERHGALAIQPGLGHRRGAREGFTYQLRAAKKQ